jgi:hypothetical protein
MNRRVIVQSVEILWTKATRGAPHADRRTALPRAFGLPFSDSVYLHDVITMNETTDFRPRRAQSRENFVPTSDQSLLFHLTGDALTVGLYPSWGQPQRKGQRELLRLAPNEYARLRFNARHTSYSAQCYTETVYHVAFGERIPENRFVDARPEHEIDWMADLF